MQMGLMRPPPDTTLPLWPLDVWVALLGLQEHSTQKWQQLSSRLILDVAAIIH